MDDQRFSTGLLDMSDAARFLGIPRATFHRWARGYPRGGPLLHVLDAAPRRAQVPFIAVTEAHVLEALRQAGVRPARIRPALSRLQKEFGREYVLAAPELATDGIDVLWDFSRTDEGQGLMAGQTGQLVMREIVEDYLRYVIRADDGYPRALQLRHCEPSKVIMDPYRAFGQPVFEGSRARVADVADMLSAGEKIYERPWELEAYRRARVQVFLLPGQALAAQLGHLVVINLREIGAITSGRIVGTWYLTESGPAEYDVAGDGD